MAERIEIDDGGCLGCIAVLIVYGVALMVLGSATGGVILMWRWVFRVWQGA